MGCWSMAAADCYAMEALMAMLRGTVAGCSTITIPAALVPLVRLPDSWTATAAAVAASPTAAVEASGPADGGDSKRARGPPAKARKGSARKHGKPSAVTLLHAAAAAAAGEAATRMAPGEYVAANRPLNTSVSYTGSQRRFRDWCQRQSPPLASLPATSDTVCRYMIYLAEVRRVKPATVRNAMTGINAAHRLEMLPVPAIGTGLTRDVMVTIAHKFGEPDVRRRPIPRSVFATMAGQVDVANFLDVRDFAMLLFLAVFGLRGSEVARIRVEHVRVHLGVQHSPGVLEDVMFLEVPKAKNDRENKGSVRAAPASPYNPHMCPVAWYNRLRALTPALGRLPLAKSRAAAAAAPAVASPDRSLVFFAVHEPSKVLSVASITARIRLMMVAAGGDVTLLGSHSGRVTFATEAGEAGVPCPIIKEAGSWSSDCVQRYIRRSLSSRLLPARAVQQSVVERPPVPTMESLMATWSGPPMRSVAAAASATGPASVSLLAWPGAVPVWGAGPVGSAHAAVEAAAACVAAVSAAQASMAALRAQLALYQSPPTGLHYDSVAPVVAPAPHMAPPVDLAAAPAEAASAACALAVAAAAGAAEVVEVAAQVPAAAAVAGGARLALGLVAPTVTVDSEVVEGRGRRDRCDDGADSSCGCCVGGRRPVWCRGAQCDGAIDSA